MSETFQPEFQPEVIAFCCRHCAYAAADLAGGTRQPYPTAIKIVELPCTGRIDVVTLLHAFEKGADGVLVAGCLSGKCHYIRGNLYARQRIDYLGSLLKAIGLEPERVRMINISAAMGMQFAQLATEHVDTVRALGPSPLRRADSAAAAIAAEHAGEGGNCASCQCGKGSCSSKATAREAQQEGMGVAGEGKESIPSPVRDFPIHAHDVVKQGESA